MKLKTTLTIVALIIAFTGYASQTRKVLVIGIDGCRSDALQQANTPHLDSLIATGLFTYDAWHLGITVSGPSWSTIMTGVWWNKHGVTSNAYTGSNFNSYPYFPTHAKEIKPSLKCVQVVEWAPMSDNVYNDGWDSKLKTPDGDGASTAAVAAAQLADVDLDCMFVYFDAVDLTGHSSGFSPTNPSYIQAIENVDANIGIVLNALYSRPNYANEDWLILITTDHGGIGTGHGGITWEERHIWWIASGKDVSHQQITASDPGTYNLLGTGIYNASGVDQNLMKTSPVQADIAVTALHHLIYDSGLQPENQSAWALDGKSWLQAFSGVNTIKEAPLTVFPNPCNGIVSVWLEDADKSQIEIRNNIGEIIKPTSINVMANKVNIDLSNQATGKYYISLITNKGLMTKEVQVVH